MHGKQKDSVNVIDATAMGLMVANITSFAWSQPHEINPQHLLFGGRRVFGERKIAGGRLAFRFSAGIIELQIRRVGVGDFLMTLPNTNYNPYKPSTLSLWWEESLWGRET